MKYNPYARVDVEKLLERLEIKGRETGGGRRFEAICPNPNHPEKTPSWFIRNNPGEPYHASHKCQGCGFGGGPLALVMAVNGGDEDDARAYLKDLAAPPPMPVKIDIEVVHHVPKEFELPPCFVMGRNPEHFPVEHREYLLARVPEWQGVRWGLGYVTRCKCKGKRHANRIAIPVRDERGKLCSYTTRAIGKARAKYVEPSQEEGAVRAIFGSQYWEEKKIVVLVEGPFDALAVERVIGKEHAVGALRGSSPHPSTLARLSMFERVILMTDPDKAGQKAREIVLNACSRHCEVVSIVLPKPKGAKKGPDPAELVSNPQGAQYLLRRLWTFLTI